MRIENERICLLYNAEGSFSPVTEREIGTVKWFNNTKGYGFIARDSGEDVFVHYTSIQGEGYRSLQEEQQVEFEVGSGEKGPQAIEVVAVN